MEKYYHSLIPYTAISKKEDAESFIMPMFHEHSSLEIFHVSSGIVSVDFYKEGKVETKHIKSGEFIIIKPLVYHRFSILQPTQITVLEIGFDNQALLINEWLRTRSVAEIPTVRKVLDSWNDLLFFYDNQNVKSILLELLSAVTSQSSSDYYYVLYEALLKRLLIEICRCKSIEHIAKGNRHLFYAQTFIMENYMYPIKIENIAGYTNISKSYLTALFKRELDSSVMDVLNAYRMKKACELLANSALPVKTVAEKSGFNQLRSFQLAFAKYNGMSPSEYRKTNQNNLPSFYKVPPIMHKK